VAVCVLLRMRGQGQEGNQQHRGEWSTVEAFHIAPLISLQGSDNITLAKPHACSKGQ
jgi:hypothetical protein